MIDWSQYEKPVFKMARDILAKFFDIRMRRLYDENYSEIILNYVKENVDNRDTKVKSVCKPLHDKFCNQSINSAVEVVDQFDITALNHFILYAEIGNITEGVDGENVILPIYHGAFSSETERKRFKQIVSNITIERNLTKHNDNILDSFECIQKINDIVLRLSEFQEFLDTKWRSNETKPYIDRVGKELTELKRELLCAVGRKGLLRLSVVDMNQNVINGMKLELLDGNELLASWVQYDKPLSIQLCDGEYILRSSESRDNYELKPKSFMVDGINSVEEQKFKADLIISDEELFRNVFQLFLNEKTDGDFLASLEYLNQKNHLCAILLLAFLKKYGIVVSKNEVEAGDYLTAADCIVSSSELEKEAKKSFDKKELYRAATLYIGLSLMNNDGKGFYNAAVIFRELQNYDFCKKCLEEAKNMGHKDAQKAYDQLVSKDVFEKRMHTN